MGETIKLMSYNLRFLTSEKNPNNNWSNRKGLVVDKMKEESADVIATQEGLFEQLRDLEWMFHGEFGWFGQGRDDGRDDGETCAIFFRKSRVRVEKQGTFWISERPHEVSISWEASCVRICTWGLFEDISNGKKFYVYNCHLDHKSELARDEGVKLIVQEAERNCEKGVPIFWTGDLNAEPTENSVKFITDATKNKYKYEDTAKLSKTGPRGPTGTFGGFTLEHNQRIDFIFLRDTSKQIQVNSYKTIHTPIDSVRNTTPSDHFPVQIEFQFAKSTK